MQRFATKHEDLIHDVAYDYFGKRLATCSSDRTIRVWDLDDNEEWRCSAEWTAHTGSIWKVHWAAPEYGQILASCSFDRTVCIWEEPEGMHPHRGEPWIFLFGARVGFWGAFSFSPRAWAALFFAAD